jgi:hypothetical protein
MADALEHREHELSEACVPLQRRPRSLLPRHHRA